MDSIPGGTRSDPVDWDEAGQLSIVIQGALYQGNLVETANHCRHWRDLFPLAQIILSISVTDVVRGPRRSGQLLPLKLVNKHRDDGHLQIAIEVISQTCDVITLATGELPLPPIKTDSPKLNNMNHQIVAAQNGLDFAVGIYVLRVRSDLVFLDRSFLDQYFSVYDLPRGQKSSLTQRVMISWLFTLNPYTVERMPLHFSDWFHFGILDDVKRLWRIPLIRFADSVHFRTRPHAAGSNDREKQFSTRLAVEQHLMYNAFKSDFPQLNLDYNNDLSSTELAMDILLDNFVMCDLLESQCYFDKYAHEFFDPAKTLHCITRKDWIRMVHARDVPYTATLSAKIRETTVDDAKQEDGPFPRTFSAFQLRTKNSRMVDGEIVSTLPNGLVFYGPYTTLARDTYSAVVDVSALSGSGSVVLKVTYDAADQVLAECRFAVEDGKGDKWEIPFSVRDIELLGVEVTCHIDGDLEVSISSVTIMRTQIEPKTGFLAKLRMSSRR